MEERPKSAPKKGAVDVLHCRNPQCAALLAYEVESDNTLHVDLAWTAHRQDGVAYFPCPKCGGKNVVEETRDGTGRVRHRVTRWLA